MKKILIIDDEDDNLSYLSAVLADNNYEVITATDGEMGLTKAQEINPDLILLDLMMPKKSGVKFLQEIKHIRALRDIPIIVQSGASGVTGVDMKEYLKQNPFEIKQSPGERITTEPQAYLEKPIDPVVLIKTVAEFV